MKTIAENEHKRGRDMNEDEAFFKQMQECREPYRLLGECYDQTLSAVLQPSQRIAYDVGCGIGAQCERMVELQWGVVGVDSREARKHKSGTNWIFYEEDLTYANVRNYISKPVCICTETAEHLPEESADSFTFFISALATRFIIWSAAQPGQEWPGHINLQKPEYWLAKFEKLGWIPNDTLTTRLRSLMAKKNAQHIHCRENFFVLAPFP